MIGGVTESDTDGPAAPAHGVDGGGSEGRPSWVWSRRANVLAGAVFVACAASVFGYIHRFAANVLYDDQWTDVDLLHHLHDGTLGLGTLWTQHNENRIFFPHLVVMALGTSTHLDVVVEAYLNGALACAFVALVIAAHRRWSPMPWLYYCPVALVLLSFSPVGDTLFGFNLTWYLALAALAATLVLLDRVAPSRLSVALAVVAAAVGSFSSVQGLFIWPAGLVVLLLRHRSRRVVATWLVSAVITTVVYFVGFDFSLAGGNDASPLHHPLFRVEYFLSVVGNVMGLYVGPAPEAVNGVAVAIGLVVVVTAAVAVVHGCRSRGRGGAPIGVALIVFGMLFALSVTFGRVQGGLQSAGRYDVFSLTIWVGAYLALVAPPATPPATPAVASSSPASALSHPARAVKATLVVLLVLMGGQWLVSTSRGLQYGREWRAYGTALANVTANIGTTTDGVVLQVLGSYPVATFRHLAVDAQAQRLSLFDTPVVAADRRSGLPSYLVTGVLRPLDGATVSGTVPLDATVGTTAGGEGATVTFRARSAGRPPVVIGTGRPTIVGWATRWDTTGLADGTYLIQSVLHRPGRPAVTGEPITVVVHNRG